MSEEKEKIEEIQIPQPAAWEQILERDIVQIKENLKDLRNAYLKWECDEISDKMFVSMAHPLFEFLKKGASETLKNYKQGIEQFRESTKITYVPAKKKD